MIYFVTLSLGVAMFYAFNALEDQNLFKYFKDQYGEDLTVLFTALNIFNKFIAFVFGLIIIYATNYILRKRKKEFGLYVILGMSKLRISSILILETFFIGIFSFSQYNQLATYFHLPKLKLTNQQYALILPAAEYFAKDVQDKLNHLPTITLSNQPFTPIKAKSINGTLEAHGYFSYMVLNDQTLTQLPLQKYSIGISILYNQKGLANEKSLA